MTRIKVLSVLAVALVLTAFTASSAFAWNGVVLSVEQNCDKQVVKVFADDTEGFLHSKDAPSHGTLTVVDSHGIEVSGSFEWKFDKTGPNHQKIGTIPLSALEVGVEYFITVSKDVTPASITVETCESPSPSASPTETASPVATVSPSASAQPEATATATPSASASPAATSTSVPSPPVTGQGSGGGSDNTFGIVLLVMVLGTVVIGGTTLALSRKGS